MFAQGYYTFLEKLGALRSDSDSVIDPSHKVLPDTFSDQTKTAPISNAVRNVYARLREKYPDEPLKKVDDYVGECAGKPLPCDFVFGLFAVYTARLVKPTFFRELLLFLCMYREAINVEGWSKQESAGGQALTAGDMDNYCETQSAEFVPDIANSFILDYFPTLIQSVSLVKQPASLVFLGKDHTRLSGLILLIRHFCSWLNMNKFSEARVDLSKS